MPNPHPACKCIQFPERELWSDGAGLYRKKLEEYHTKCDEEIKRWNTAKVDDRGQFRQEKKMFEAFFLSKPPPREWEVEVGVGLGLVSSWFFVV